jgi:predicted P-loop ATPase/GTPase
VDANDKYIDSYLEVIEHILKYKLNRLNAVVIESINGEAAPRSPYLAALRMRFEVTLDPNSVTVYRQWTSSA